MAESLREALDRPLAGTIDAESWNTALATDTGDLLDHTSRWLLFAHDIQRFLRHLDESEEVDFHLPSVLLLCELFKDTGEAVAGIVDDDIDTLELVNCGFECSFNIRFLGDIELDRKVVLESVSN